MTKLIEFPPGIDTLERRIVQTASLLGGVTADSEGTDGISKEKTRSAIKIGWELRRKHGGITEPTLIIEANIYYSAAIYQKLGGNLIASLLTFGDELPDTPDDIDPSDTMADLPEVPDGIMSLEHLLVSDLLILAASTYPDYSYLKTQLYQKEEPPRQLLTVSLPFNYQVYCLSQNFTQAVDSVTDEYVVFLEDLEV